MKKYYLLLLIGLLAISSSTAQAQEEIPNSSFEYYADQSVVLMRASSGNDVFGWTCRDGAPVVLLYLNQYDFTDRSRDAPVTVRYELVYRGQGVSRDKRRHEQQATWHPWQGSPPVPGIRLETASPSDAIRLRQQGEPPVVEVDRWEGGAWFVLDGEEASAFVEALLPAGAEVTSVSMYHADGDVIIPMRSFYTSDSALDVLPCMARGGSGE